MVKFEGKERRRRDRVALATSCISSFTYKGKLHSAIMVDISEHGAKFIVEKPSDHIELILGDELIVSITTPYGTTTCSGEIVWSRHSEEYYSWGLEFTRLSSDNRDPLRCLMESPF